MVTMRWLLLHAALLGLGACGASPPSGFSNAVRTDSGIAATGQSGDDGGSAGAAPGSGVLSRTTVP